MVPRSTNIFDNMLAMMEKYANRLETLVDDRTQQLAEEKKKTENLLLTMLPKFVFYYPGRTRFMTIMNLVKMFTKLDFCKGLEIMCPG